MPEFTIAERLRLARELKGFTQDELADRIDSTRSTIRNYENRGYLSKRKPMVLKQWGLATGISPAWLETGEGEPVRPGPDGPGPGKGRPDELAKLTAARRSRAQGSAGDDGSVTRAYPEAA